MNEANYNKRFSEWMDEKLPHYYTKEEQQYNGQEYPLSSIIDFCCNYAGHL